MFLCAFHMYTRNAISIVLHLEQEILQHVLLLHVRNKAYWSGVQARFDKSESPAENDILLVLDYMQLRLRMLGKSMDCLQESGNSDFEAFTVCSATLDVSGVKFSVATSF